MFTCRLSASSLLAQHALNTTDNIASANRQLLFLRRRYSKITAEDLAEKEPAQFDVVVASEVIEHVNQPPQFCESLAALLTSDGCLVVSTLSRTVPAYALAILGAEYLLRLVPTGTHDWNKFITPEELSMMASDAGLAMQHLTGMAFNPVTRVWSFTDVLEINYIASFHKLSLNTGTSKTS